MKVTAFTDKELKALRERIKSAFPPCMIICQHMTSPVQQGCNAWTQLCHDEGYMDRLYRNIEHWAKLIHERGYRPALVFFLPYYHHKVPEGELVRYGFRIVYHDLPEQRPA